ncbi:hypothetical protein V2J09_016430 [Rumex salicifolius]
MAFKRTLLLTLLLLTLLASHYSMAQTTTGKAASIDCAGGCKYRCSKSWKPKMCNKLCSGCCKECGCVPQGPTASRTSACSCYAQRRNPKTGAFKCP